MQKKEGMQRYDSQQRLGMLSGAGTVSENKKPIKFVRPDALNTGPDGTSSKKLLWLKSENKQPLSP